MALAKEALEIGDVVILKSGGPEMTVSALGLPGTVFTVWFDGKDNICSSDFNEECLKKI